MQLTDFNPQFGLACCDCRYVFCSQMGSLAIYHYLLWRSVVRSVAKLTGKLFDYRILSND
jgi:hypothetical protein